MGGLFWNKIFAAILVTGLVIFVIKEVSHSLIHSTQPEKPGYAIEVTKTQENTAPAEEVKQASLEELLANANVEAGARVAKKCVACHTFEKDGGRRLGPNLWDIVGNKTAHVESFGYSAALKNAGLTWSFENLDAFFTKPQEFMPGTIMGFAGIKKPKDRANLIAWLRTHSDNPVALPTIADNVVEEAAQIIEKTSEAVADAIDSAEVPSQ